MRVLAKILRRAGVVIAREELVQRPWTVIHLLTEPDKTGHRRLVIREAEAGPVSEPRLELFQVTLASVTVDQFVLRGIERVESSGCTAAVVQELACKLVPALGGEGWASPLAKEFSRDFQSLVP